MDEIAQHFDIIVSISGELTVIHKSVDWYWVFIRDHNIILIAVTIRGHVFDTWFGSGFRSF